MTECNGSSSYEPSAIAQAFHSIPRADIDLNEAPDQFSLELSYYEAIIIWICAPIILCICIFILLSVYYICVCCCCCCRQKKKRSKTAKRSCACFVSILIGVCLGIIGASLYAEVELDRNIVRAIDNGENINTTLTQVVDQVSNYPAFDVDAALSEIMNLVNTSEMDLQSDLDAIAEANSNIDEGFTSVVQILTGNDTSFFYTEAVTAVSLYETVRHWSIIGYLCLIAILLIVIFITVVCFSPAGIVVFLVFLCIFTFTVWVAVGGALGLGIVLGDVCSDPDAIVRNLSSNNPQALDVTNYYLSCQCDPFAQDKAQINNAIMEVMMVEGQIRTFLDNISDTSEGQAALEQFNIITAILDDAENSVNNVTELLLCQPEDGINAYYDDALLNLCTQGFVYVLVQFSLLAGLAVMMVVLICCSTFFSGLLVSSRKGEDYDQRDIVAFDTEHSVSWANRRSSYSEPYISNGSTFHPPKESYNTGHGSGLVSVAPPNYTDLHAARTSGRFSGEYDHFDA